jgi:hypothetical protein
MVVGDLRGGGTSTIHTYSNESNYSETALVDLTHMYFLSYRHPDRSGGIPSDACLAGSFNCVQDDTQKGMWVS